MKLNETMKIRYQFVEDYSIVYLLSVNYVKLKNIMNRIIHSFSNVKITRTRKKQKGTKTLYCLAINYIKR